MVEFDWFRVQGLGFEPRLQSSVGRRSWLRWSSLTVVSHRMVIGDLWQITKTDSAMMLRAIWFPFVGCRV